MIFRDLANAFGMSVANLAEIMGFSRQAIYAIGQGAYASNRKRMRVSLIALRHISDDMYEKDIKEAAARKNARDIELDRLEERYKEGVI